MSELSDKERKISRAAVWVWRNLLASGVFIVLFWIGYNWIGNEFDGVKAKIDNVEHEVIEVRTVVQERIRVERGDYGWAEPSYPEPELTEDQFEQGMKIRQHIDSFANEGPK